MRTASIFISLVIALGATLALVNIQPANARALERGILTSEHIEIIRNNCGQAQSIMTQLHKSDQLLRVNQGQIYESITSKLMAPFNSRAGLNRYDTSQLATITNNFNNNLNDYRDLYKDYDAALQKALDIDCRNQPVPFYDSVAVAREKRQAVHDKIGQLFDNIDQYEDEFNRLIEEGPISNV